ncbi:MAG: hypothetical protein HY049_11650 [Acidobacteria bacterium]|nr:hypothetical protein [Acidobacteriota bacterium]
MNRHAMIPRRALASLAAIALLAPAAGARAAAPGLVRNEDALVALYTLQTQIDVERKLLQTAEAQYDANLKRRGELGDRLARLHDELEDLFVQEKPDAPARAAPNQARPLSEAEVRQAVGAKEIEVLAVERAETAAQDEARRMRDDIRRMRTRIALLGKQLDSLRATLPSDSDSVTGLWDITLLPSGDRGVFALWQSGTIVSGQYVLDGPFRGSLEGTLVNRQILLRRIDARLGRSMELSGYLAGDGASIQGTWQNYDLSTGRAPSGAWSARKRKSVPSESPAPGEPAP